MPMRRLVLALVATLAMSGCLSSTDGVRRANDVVGRSSPRPVTVSGTLVGRDGQPVLICSDSGIDVTGGWRCPHGGLTVEGLDLALMPRIQRVGSVRFVSPDVLLQLRGARPRDRACARRRRAEFRSDAEWLLESA